MRTDTNVLHILRTHTRMHTHTHASATPVPLQGVVTGVVTITTHPQPGLALLSQGRGLSTGPVTVPRSLEEYVPPRPYKTHTRRQAGGLGGCFTSSPTPRPAITGLGDPKGPAWLYTLAGRYRPIESHSISLTPSLSQRTSHPRGPWLHALSE